MTSPSTNIGEFVENVSTAAKIFDEYGDFIYNIISHKAKNKAEVDDLYQDFFLSLVSKPIPHDVQNVKNYLYKAITNDIADANRRMQRYITLMNKYADNFNFPINKPSTTNAIIIGEKIEKIFSLVRGFLTPAEAKAITLRYKNDCSNTEIAKEIGVRKESVGRYICAGLKKIRQMLVAKEDN